VTLSEVDVDEVVRENDERFKLAEKLEAEKRKLAEQYQSQVRKLEGDVESAVSRADTRVFEGLQRFVDVLILELDKLLRHISGVEKAGATTGSTEETNRTIAKMLIAILPDGRCGKLLESFKGKLNGVLFAFKRALETQYKKQGELPCPITATIAERETATHADLSIDSKREETAAGSLEGGNAGECNKYIEAMDAEYEKNVLSKVSPIRNSNGKYVVDIEKVFSDLLLVKDALTAVFHKSSKSNTYQG
jgi:hypothetical protein